MNKWKAAVVLGLTVALMAVAAPAQAQQITVSDPAGDTTGRGLDIVSAKIRNRDHALVTKVRFAKDIRGTFIEAIRLRHGHLFALVIEHRKTGADTIHLISRQSGELQCANMTSTWDRPAARVRLRLPSSCLDEGNYGALRVWLLSEKRNGSDVDLAPTNADESIRFTSWIPRG
jgi:hypothetical protein